MREAAANHIQMFGGPPLRFFREQLCFALPFVEPQRPSPTRNQRIEDAKKTSVGERKHVLWSFY